MGEVARTKLDFLYQEVLGEVDQLLKRIESVDLDLTEQVQAAETQLAGTVGKLVMAAKGIEDVTEQHKKAIHEWTATKANEAARKIAKAAGEEVDNVRMAMNELAGGALANAANALNGATEERKQQGARQWMIASGIALGSGIISSGLTYLLIH
jgi:hypothetical protein